MKKFILIIFVFLFVLCGCKKQEEVIIEEPVEIKPEVKEPIVTTTTLIMGGDAICHESVYLDAQTADGYDFSYPLEDIKKIVEPYDLAYYNQETVLGGKEYGVSGYPGFNSPKEIGEGLIDAGFNLISLASNHTLDYYGSMGSTLVRSELDFFSQYKDVLTSGVYESDEDKNELRIKEINGLTYSMLSYTYGSNQGLPSSDESYLLNFIDKEKIKEDVLKYRDKVDLLIVAMHWGVDGGVDYSATVTDEQIDLANYLASLDVDIVIGNHSHVLQPITFIDDTLVIYSLGNLISNQYFNIDNLSSALVSLDVVKTDDEGKITVELKNIKADLIFTVLDDSHKVYLYRDISDSELPDKDYYFNKYKDILKSEYEDLIVE